MTKQIRVISDSDWEVLKRIVALNQNLQQAPPSRPNSTGQYLDGDDSMSPEVYIALPPIGGIPGLTSIAAGTASDNPPAEGDRPGFADCSVYRISNGILKPVPGLTRRVYNLSESTIISDWVTVQRDKFGTWLVVVSSGGTSSALCHWIGFTVVSEESATRSVLAIVNAVPPGFTVADVPDLITPTNLVHICDSRGCYFNETPGALVGREGWAKYMLPVLPTLCQPGDSDDTGTATAIGDEPFVPQWEVWALCCSTTECA